jgi:hypothetical protein
MHPKLQPLKYNPPDHGIQFLEQGLVHPSRNVLPGLVPLVKHEQDSGRQAIALELPRHPPL